MGEDKQRPDDTRQVIESIGEGAKSTVVLQGKILKKLYQATLGAIGRRFARATWLGKLFILAGLLGALGLGFLIARECLVVGWERSRQVVLSSAVEARQGPDERSGGLARVAAGERLVRVGEAEEWWSVQQPGWRAPGWIPKAAGRAEDGLRVVIDYRMKGYGSGFLGALLLMCIGFWLKKRV
ncbi:MAG TPA: hypothetical protein PK668_13390 [Myxococcota bacterium]|nr:hypothetical protein [Myxococcota bacterium]HRY94144.1 hypothetical protein [Myxococcota bacterium]